MTARRTGAVAIWLMVAAVASVVAQSGGTEVPNQAPWWGWVLLGRLHPLVVHFPIGLILAGALFETAQWMRRRPLPSEVGTYCLGLGLASGVAAVAFGTLNASHQSITGESAAILDWHRASGWAVLAVGAAALLAGRLVRDLTARGSRAIYTGLVMTSALLVGATGHFGGQLVYGSTYVTSVLPWNQATGAPLTASTDVAPVVTPASLLAASPAAGALEGLVPAPTTPTATPTTTPTTTLPPTTTPMPAREPAAGPVADPLPAAPAAAPTPQAAAQPAATTPPPNGTAAAVAAPAAAGRVDFARQIAPILKASCVECHGPEKVKARLRMDSVAHLQAGGKNGPLFVPGDAEASLLMRRVLGLDDEDQMPLDNDPLPAEQIELLRRWINEGARYEPRANDSQP